LGDGVTGEVTAFEEIGGVGFGGGESGPCAEDIGFGGETAFVAGFRDSEGGFEGCEGLVCSGGFGVERAEGEVLLGEVASETELDGVAGEDGEAGEHALAHVIGDVAVVEPGAGVVGGEVGGLHGGREELDDIGAAAAILDDAEAVPVGGVEIALGAEAEQIPARALALVHLETGKVAEEEAVDGRAGAVLEELLGAGPPQSGPSPPRNGTTNGVSLAGGSRVAEGGAPATGERHCSAAAAARGDPPAGPAGRR
jgi:hypothetical protein